MLPITNIIIEEYVKNVHDDIFTFKCKGCGDTREAHIDPSLMGMFQYLDYASVD